MSNMRCRLSHGQSVVSSRAASSGPQAQRRLRGSAGRARCTLELLCNERVRIADDGSISRETGRRLAKNRLKPWRQDRWCIPKVDAARVAAMEDVLDLHNEPHDPDRPVISFDETRTMSALRP